MSDNGTPAIGRAKVAVAIDMDWAGRHLVDAVGAAAALDSDEATQIVVRGGVWIGRHRVQDANAIVADGDLLTIHFPPYDVRRAVIGAGDIVWEDDLLLVINKPPGVYVSMTPWDATNDVRWAVQQFILHRDGPGVPLHMVHQLDRDTSGVLVFSKDPRANSPLQDAFLRGLVEKEYLACVAGVPQWHEVTIETGHGRGPHGLFRVYPLADVGMHPEGRPHSVKYMKTRFEAGERFPNATLIHAHPMTGRTHQIRLHLAYAGFPVLGDERYGGPTEVGGVTIHHHLLHAARMCLPHPLTWQPLELVAPLPPLFAQTLHTLRET